MPLRVLIWINGMAKRVGIYIGREHKNREFIIGNEIFKADVRGRIRVSENKLKKAGIDPEDKIRWSVYRPAPIFQEGAVIQTRNYAQRGAVLLTNNDFTRAIEPDMDIVVETFDRKGRMKPLHYRYYVLRDVLGKRIISLSAGRAGVQLPPDYDEEEYEEEG